MRVSSIDRSASIVTYADGEFEFPVQEDLDFIPGLRVGDEFPTAPFNQRRVNAQLNRLGAL